MKLCRKTFIVLVLICAGLPAARAVITLPSIISDHMVLQQQQANPIWGWDVPGARVSVKFAGHEYETVANAEGWWAVRLQPQPANAKPQTIAIAGTTKRVIQDVLIGEVWLCSGQSNMDLKLDYDLNGDLEAAVSNLSNLRLILVPQSGPPESQLDFKGEWRAATPETAKHFSAVGFLFGRYIHQALGVPVGLIDDTWGGSTTEAWIPREALAKDPRFVALMTAAAEKDADLLSVKGKADYERAVSDWKAACEKAALEKRPLPGAPPDWHAGGQRPGNLFAGMINPLVGYGLKGVVWYQGEANASRAYEHGALFPFLIEQWRRAWQQGDFSFYWVQLPKFGAEKIEPGNSDWAELRETQTQALSLPHTGQAVTIDLGEAQTIHPRNKRDVAVRLARWALVKDYGLQLPYRSPEFKDLTIAGSGAIITFDCFASSLRTFDVADVRGFALCGKDRVWHRASARIIAPDRVEVQSVEVPAPVAVRYAWADNPVCNLISNDYLPATPFRTDDFDMITKPRTTFSK